MIELKHHGAHARGREHRDLVPVRSVDELDTTGPVVDGGQPRVEDCGMERVPTG